MRIKRSNHLQGTILFPAIVTVPVLIVTCFFLLAFSGNTAFATWKKIAQFPTTVNASFFFNEQRGIVAMDGVKGIKRTSDGGQTWIDCTIPSGFTDYFTDIFMKDSLHGWVGIEEHGSVTAHGLWSTADGGASWQPDQNLAGNVTGVYQVPSGLFITDRFGSNGFLVSPDGGTAFFHAGIDHYTGINFVDDLHGVVTVFTGLPMFTSDGGRTWRTTSSLPGEAWSVYGQKGTSNFIAVPEKIANDQSTSEAVFRSTDYGATWLNISDVPFRTTGHIAGVGPVMYVQSHILSPNQESGMLRSTDGGINWKFVNGPANYRDTRFSVTGCIGNVVYSFDTSGGVWKTTDGGDGLITDVSHTPNFSAAQITLSATPCDIATSGLSYANLSCSNMKIESIGFTDSSNQAITSGAISFIRYPKLPQTLSSASEDSIVLQWQPKKLPIVIPLSQTFIKIHGSFPNSTTVFDTILGVSAESQIQQPAFRPQSINFPDTRIRQQTCTTFTLKNTLPPGSKNFILETASYKNQDGPYQITYISKPFPATVAPQDSVLIQLCFWPYDKLHYKDTLFLATDCFTFGIALDGQGTTGFIVAGDLDFGHVTVGDTVCKDLFIKNTGTAVFVLEKIFTLSNPLYFSIDTTALPAFIQAGDSVAIRTCFFPNSDGVFHSGIDWLTDLQPPYDHFIKTHSSLSGMGDLPAGVTMTPNSPPFSIRPNPTQNELNIEITEDISRETPIEIFDVLGKKVFSENRNMQTGTNRIRLDTKNLAAGIYTVRIGNAAQNFVKE